MRYICFLIQLIHKIEIKICAPLSKLLPFIWLFIDCKSKSGSIYLCDYLMIIHTDTCISGMSLILRINCLQCIILKFHHSRRKRYILRMLGIIKDFWGGTSYLKVRINYSLIYSRSNLLKIHVNIMEPYI